MMTFEEMELEARRMEAEDQVHNLISNYCFEHNMALQMRYFNQWAKRDDVRHEMPWGNTTGLENLEYNNPWSDRIRHPKDANTLPPGTLMLHLITTPVIESAEDCKSVRCVFLSPGIEASHTMALSGMDEGAWAYSKYAYEMIEENGEWKVWHQRIFPVFRNGYFDDFAKVPEEDLTKEHIRDGLMDFNAFFNYRPDCIVPRNEPDVPRPYKTWEPGWNFGMD